MVTRFKRSPQPTKIAHAGKAPLAGVQAACRDGGTTLHAVGERVDRRVFTDRASQQVADRWTPSQSL